MKCKRVGFNTIPRNSIPITGGCLNFLEIAPSILEKEIIIAKCNITLFSIIILYNSLLI